MDAPAASQFEEPGVCIGRDEEFKSAVKFKRGMTATWQDKAMMGGKTSQFRDDLRYLNFLMGFKYLFEFHPIV